MSEKKIFIVRHGQRCDVVHPSLRHEYPNPLDPRLTDLGRYQSQCTKNLIACFTNSEKSLKVVSSPFLGCIETALEISSRVSVDWRFSDLLHVLNYPVDIKDSLSFKTEWFKNLYFDVDAAGSLPEYPENYDSMKTRALSGFYEHLSNSPEAVMVIVTHLLPLEVISEVFAKDQVKLRDEGFCSVTYGTVNGDSYQLVLLADHTHARQYSKQRS